MKTKYLILLLGLFLLLSGCGQLVYDYKPPKIADGYLEIPSTSFPTISEGIKEHPRSDICVINHKKQEEIYTKHTEG